MVAGMTNPGDTGIERQPPGTSKIERRSKNSRDSTKKDSRIFRERT